MPWRYAFAALAVALVLSGPTPEPQVRAARLSGAPDAAGDGGTPSRLLEQYGEPSLAWDALRRAGGPRTDAETRMAARLLTELRRYAEADSFLARVAPPVDPYQAALERVQRARLNVECRRYGRAAELLPGGALPDAALATYRDYLLVRIHTALGSPETAAAVLENLNDDDVPDALRVPVAEARVSVFRDLGRARDAMTSAAQAARRTGDAAATRRLLLEQFTTAQEAGDAGEARRAAQSLFADHASSSEAEQAAGALLGADGGKALPASLLLSGAEVLSRQHDTTDLRKALRTLDSRRLSEHDAEQHRILWAEYHYDTGDFSRAIALARPSYADPALRRRSMLVMARALRKLGKRSEAGAVYEQFARAFPNDRIAAEALYAAASLYRQDNRDAESARVLDQLRRAYPSTFHGWAAAMRRADDLSREGHGADAVAIYEQWLSRSRRTDEAALFYLARERERMQPGSGATVMDELRALNAFSFYVSPDVVTVTRGPLHDSSGGVLRAGPGSLAEWLARAEQDRSLAYQRVLDVASESGESAGGTDRAMERALFFLQAGLRDWGEAELDAARRHGRASAESNLRLARLYDEYAMPWRSVRLYERAASGLPWQERREHRDDLRVLTHPLPYPAQVLDNAARNGIPPHLVYGIMREESRFEADVVSRAGAVGLMQLMPQTARRLAAQLDITSEIDERLDEPEVNVSLGVWYAADLLREGKGSVAWMLAAYNAGPGAADRWIEPGVSGTDAIDAVESIDYKETRGYVKRVVESANVYQSLYFSGSGAGR